MATSSDAEALKSVLSDLSTLAVRDLVRFWRRYGDEPGVQDLLVAAFPEIVGPPASAAAMVTAQWYNELAPELPFQAVPVVDLPADRMLGTLDWAFNAPGEASPLDRVAGSTQRMIFDTSRGTVLENLAVEYGDDAPQPAGTRWARYASATACSFCRVMATRGAVYRSAAAATTVVGNGQRWHDNCRCVAVPVRPGQVYEPPDYVEQWEQDYLDAVDAAREAGETRGESGAIDLNAVVRHMDRARN